MKTSDFYTAEWNYNQVMPHIQTLDRYLAESLKKTVEEKPQEWILIGVFSKHEDASIFLDAFELEIGAKAKRKELWGGLLE